MLDLGVVLEVFLIDSGEEKGLLWMCGGEKTKTIINAITNIILQESQGCSLISRPLLILSSINS